MAIISSSNLIRSLSLYHLTLAFYLISAPWLLTNQSLVQVLSASMQLDAADYAFSSTSATSSLAGIFLAFIALTDFTAVSLPEDIYNIYWATQAPVRLVALFGLATWIYVFKPAATLRRTVSATGKGWGHEAKNGVTFTWTFVETMMIFWVGFHSLVPHFVPSLQVPKCSRSLPHCEKSARRARNAEPSGTTKLPQ